MKGLLYFLTVIAIAVISVSYIFGTVVPPGMMGVRQINFGPYQGFAKNSLRPGYHWSIPFYSVVHLVPQTIQTISPNREDGGLGNSVEVQTSDGSSVDVDVSIMIRVYPEPAENHGGPSDLLQRIGTKPNLWIDRVRTASVNEIRKHLGRLSTSEFYIPHKRELGVEEAVNSLDDRLKEFGIKVDAILLRRYTYSEERIDTAIFQKNLQDQEERLNNAKKFLAQARAELEKVAAEWDAKIITLRIEGENKAKVLRSEAELYETTQQAEGDLLVAKARAEVDRLKAGALATSAGADIFVGKALAPLLTSLKGGLVTQLDPYDLNSWAEKLGVSEMKGSLKSNVE